MEKADAGATSGRGGPDKRLISFLRSIDKATEREEAEAGERVRSRKRAPAGPLNEESDASDGDGQGMEEEGAEESGWEDEQPGAYRIGFLAAALGALTRARGNSRGAESAPPIEFANAMARILGKHADGVRGAHALPGPCARSDKGCRRAGRRKTLFCASARHPTCG